MVRKKVLIAVGDKDYTNILKQNFANYQENFTLSSQEVLHRRYLQEIVELEKPDILIVHDTYLPSSYSTKEERENELLAFIRLFNTMFDESLRFVFLCERPVGDPFLSTLVSIGVRDIFNTSRVPLDVFFKQLIDKPRLANVEKFFLLSQQNTGPMISLDLLDSVQKKTKEPDEPKKTDKKDKKDKPKAKDKQKEKDTEKEEKQSKVQEKTIVKKIINKNVIKRDYHIQILNKTEKVVGVPVKKKFLLIGSLLPGSGSTFISHLFARAIAQMGVSVAYVENPYTKPYTYERFNGDHKVNRYRSMFYEYSDKQDNSNSQSMNISTDWDLEQVSIICKNPKQEPVYGSDEFDFDTWIKILYSIPSTITIIDVGSNWDNTIFRDLCDIADHVYIVLNPDVLQIRQFQTSKDSSAQFLRELLNKDKASLIGNRFTPQILDKKIMKELHQIIPSLPAHDVFESQHKGIFLNDYKEYQTILKPLLSPFLKEIIPKELLNKRQSSNLLKKVFGKKIAVRKTEKNV